MIKFCWADFTPDTKIDELFAEYNKTMAQPEAAYPHVTFVHFTVPLTVTQAGVKAWVKRIDWEACLRPPGERCQKPLQ